MLNIASLPANHPQTDEFSKKVPAWYRVNCSLLVHNQTRLFVDKNRQSQTPDNCFAFTKETCMQL
jgi:hypothetical protein